MKNPKEISGFLFYNFPFKQSQCNIKEGLYMYKQYTIVGYKAKEILKSIYELPIPKLERKWTPELLELIYKENNISHPPPLV